MEKWRWRHNLPTQRNCLFFNVAVFFLSSLVTGPSFMSMSLLDLKLRQFLFRRDLTRRPEIGNTPVWLLSNTWRLGQIRDTKFGLNIFNKKLLNDTKCQVLNFHHFLSYYRKTNRGGREGGGGGRRAVKIPTTRLELSNSLLKKTGQK